MALWLAVCYSAVYLHLWLFGEQSSVQVARNLLTLALVIIINVVFVASASATSSWCNLVCIRSFTTITCTRICAPHSLSLPFSRSPQSQRTKHMRKMKIAQEIRLSSQGQRLLSVQLRYAGTNVSAADCTRYGRVAGDVSQLQLQSQSQSNRMRSKKMALVVANTNGFRRFYSHFHAAFASRAQKIAKNASSHRQDDAS